MGDIITRCPACGTNFKVTAAQLAVAEGLVRCGQCAHVFSANDCGVDSQQASTTVEQRTDPLLDAAAEEDGEAPDIESALRFAREVPPEEPDTEAPDAELDLDWLNNEIGASELEIDEPPAADPDVDEDQLLFDDMGPRLEKDVINEELARANALRDSAFDTAFFASLNYADDEQEESASPSDRASSTNALDQDFASMQWGADAEKNSEQTDANESRWALELIENLQREQEGSQAAQTAKQAQMRRVGARDTSKNSAAAKRVEHDDFSIDEDTELDSFNINGQLDDQLDKLENSYGYYPDEDDSYVSDFDAARRGGWLWATGVLLLCLVFAAQYVAFNFVSLATDPRFRPLLAQLCDTVQCQLPVLENLQKIASENLVVRSNPEQTEALLVDVIITNHAEFAQPFPALQLTFSNLRGSVIATHNFYPKQYLQGDLAGLTLMPSQNPIHLAFDIPDPGPNAINYKLTLIRGYD